MKTFRYEVVLQVEVDAFEESDAWDAVQDAFGLGEQMGVNIVDCKYLEKAKKKNAKS